jgi:amidase
MRRDYAMIPPAALTQWTATELAAGIRSGRVSAAEVLAAHLERIDTLNPQLNAVVVRNDDDAHRSAARVDAALAAGRAVGPLAGVPVTIKEAFEVAGLATTCGMQAYADHVADSDAPAVARLRDAGAVILGKTNVPVALADLQSNNPIYGRTSNLWDPQRSPGGSSGGSAAAVAAGFSALDLGSDLSGSIRVPAAWCGVFGLRPSNGLVSKRGHLPVPPDRLYEPPISVAGPLARSAADLRLALDALAGRYPEGRRPGIARRAGPDRSRFDRARRVAVWAKAPGAAVGRETAAVIDHVATALQEAGWEVVELSAPFAAEEGLEVMRRLVFAELVASMTDVQWEAAAGGAPDLRDHLVDQERRLELAQLWDEAIDGFEALLCPAVAVPALPHDDRSPDDREVDIDGHSFPYRDLSSWSLLASLGQGPSVTFPAALGARSGLPIGLQLVGRRWSDRRLVDLAGDVDRVLGHPLRHWAG